MDILKNTKYILWIVKIGSGNFLPGPVFFPCICVNLTAAFLVEITGLKTVKQKPSVLIAATNKGSFQLVIRD